MWIPCDLCTRWFITLFNYMFCRANVFHPILLLVQNRWCHLGEDVSSLLHQSILFLNLALTMEQERILYQLIFFRPLFLPNPPTRASQPSGVQAPENFE